MIALRAAKAAWQLDGVRRPLFARTLAPEKPYDVAADPWEVRDPDPEFAKTVELMKQCAKEGE
jgi:hypothetical protein